MGPMMPRLFVFFLAVLGLAVWFIFGVDTQWMSGQHRLIAIDTMENMMLVGPSSNTVVGPTVFAIGTDYKYIVLKQHPMGDGFKADRSVTNYFVIDFDSKLKGPLTKEEFDALSASLSLPSFTTVFSELE